jgi:choline dehydrogenase-like flavoprotein
MKYYDLIIVGSGFASSFFLKRFLEKTQNKNKKVLVIEKGKYMSYNYLLDNRIFLQHLSPNYYSTNSQKPWNFSIAFGGSSNCWFGTTLRMLPEDFNIQTKYGVGFDWPISYDDLEEYYSMVEATMNVSGDKMPYPMSSSFPLPPHKFSTIDTMLKKHYPNDFFHLPSARTSLNGKRNNCCNNGQCYLCPLNAKFTILNGLNEIYEKSNVEIIYESTVNSLDIIQNSIQTVEFFSEGKLKKAKGELFVLGANALYNPFILLKSGLDDGIVGTGLCEQVGASFTATFDNIENKKGTTITTGIGFNYARGENRKHEAAFIYQTTNRANTISLKENKWLNQFEIIVAIEDLPQKKNKVMIDKNNEFTPYVHYETHSPYAEKTYNKLPGQISKLLEPLAPMEIDPPTFRRSESHIQCTTMMGNNKKNSVVDAKCIHHTVRNLIVLGSSCFPTASPVNPTLTLSALSLYAADKL